MRSKPKRNPLSVSLLQTPLCPSRTARTSWYGLTPYYYLIRVVLHLAFCNVPFLAQLSGLSQKFLDIFVVPVELLPGVRLGEVPLHSLLIGIALCRPGEDFAT